MHRSYQVQSIRYDQRQQRTGELTDVCQVGSVHFSPNIHCLLTLVCPLTQDRSSSLQNLSPFQDDNERYRQLSEMCDGEDQDFMDKDARTMYHAIVAKNNVGMSQSRSEGRIQYQKQPALGSRYIHSDMIGGFPCIRLAGDGNAPLIDRGRPTNRSPSPVKTLDDIKEEPDCEKVAPKRAHSPIKQLFGDKGWLGRSTSMKELPSEEYRKTGIKHRVEKLKEKMLGKVLYITLYSAIVVLI